MRTNIETVFVEISIFRFCGDNTLIFVTVIAT